MQFYSHSKESDTGNTIGSKLLKDHLAGVLQKSLLRLGDVDLGLKKNDLSEWLSMIVKLHDLGKYTSYFQNYLLKIDPIDHNLKQHARIGGLAAYNYFKNKDEKLALISLYLIFLHHSKLIDIIDLPNKLDEHLKRTIHQQIQDLHQIIPIMEKELGLNNVSKLLKFPDERLIRRGFIIWSKREQNIRDYFLINYLFSLLIEADKLDASDTQIYQLKPITARAVDDRFGIPRQSSTSENLKSLSNNELRNFCRAEVVNNLKRSDILDHYIFTLTAPTGIGKTMTALDFALKLKRKIRERLKFEAHIIYALPFVNIIEQALNEYKTTLPKSTKILGHYQYADVFGEDKNERSNQSEEQNYNQKLMTLDTWQGDIIITSFVQFFETLIGNKNKLLKKFNHLANSVIILDEVQTLRLDQMPLIGAILFYLAKFLKARIILMTATKPKIFELAQSQILSKENEIALPVELLNSYMNVFSCFERTTIRPLIENIIDNDNKGLYFVENIFLHYWNQDKSCIIVCNTVKRSIEIFEALKSYFEENNLPNPIEYLSTNIVPTHRFLRIQRIQEKVKSGLAPILVSTQVVEAGVDLNFDMGFRDIGPIDSIIQVAGRVNRNNNPHKAHSPIYIVDFGDANKIYGKVTYEQAKKALRQHDIIKESDYLKLINEYFDNLTNKKSFSEFNKIFESMKMLRYNTDLKEERPVSSFKIIEESNTTQSVFIELTDQEINLKAKYSEKILGLINKEDFDKNYKQEFQQRIITIPDYLTKELPFINEYDENIKMVSNEVLDQYYNEETGFIRTEDKAVRFF